MKKKKIILACTLCLLCGCSSKQPLVQEGRTVGAIVEINKDEIPDYRKGKIYSSELWKWNEDIMVDTFVSQKQAERKATAIGISYAYEDEHISEYLILKDGGKEFGMEEEEGGGEYGGFTYAYEDTEKGMNRIQYSYVCSGVPEREKEIMLEYPKADEQDVAFMQYQEVKEETDRLLTDITGRELQIVNAYAVQPEIAQKKMEELNETTREEAFGDSIWEANDGAYMMTYNQMIDQIPVVDVLWTDRERKVGEAPYTLVTVLKNGNGLVEIDALGLHTLTDKGEEKELISFEQALDVIKKKYEYVTKKTVVTEAKMCYIAVQTDVRFHYQLLPTWLFTVEQERERMVGTESVLMTMTEYVAVNAVTGEIAGLNG